MIIGITTIYKNFNKEPEIGRAVLMNILQPVKMVIKHYICL